MLWKRLPTWALLCTPSDGCPFYVDNNNSLLVVTASAKTPWDLAVDILLRKVSSSGMHQPVKVEIILGNPGIGKSRQLQYAFLQYLARGVQNVVFHQAQNDKLWLFHRNEDTGLYEAYTSLGIAQMRGGVLGDPSTVALLDPYQETCVSVDCLSMVASSPNTSRYKEALKHAASTHYLPTLNVEELAACCHSCVPSVIYLGAQRSRVSFTTLVASPASSSRKRYATVSDKRWSRL